MLQTKLALIVLVVLLPGCMAPRIIPNPTIPHQLTQPVAAKITIRKTNGELLETAVKIPQGWWVVSDEVMRGAE